MSEPSRRAGYLIAAALVVVLAMPLTNLVGCGKNELVAVAEGQLEFAAVSPLLQTHCVDCHAPDVASLPAYGSVPFVRDLIEAEQREGTARWLLAPEQLTGERPLSDLQLARLEGAVRRQSMPPEPYLLLHWGAAYAPHEQQAILDWIRGARAASPAARLAALQHRGEPLQVLERPTGLVMKKVALGDKLFHDVRLSGDDTLSCASCHGLNKGGTDQARVSVGIDGQRGPVNAPTVFNASYNVRQFWDGRARDLQHQAADQVEDPVAMGAKFPAVILKLKRDLEYVTLFDEVYPEQRMTRRTITDALAEFEKSLVTVDSRFDKYLRGVDQALTEEEKRGYALFKTLGCTSCHFGPAVGGRSFDTMGLERDYFPVPELATEADWGRFNTTGRGEDRHVFKTPTLRNIAVTHPYLHDGSALTLDDAVRVMMRYQLGLEPNAAGTARIVAFLRTLTGSYLGTPLAEL